jgi:hypothetical protein
MLYMLVGDSIPCDSKKAISYFFPLGKKMFGHCNVKLLIYSCISLNRQ